ncbi:MAG: hypothetical protein E7160_03675 [Firmicutes bacterium]|nr:hypothetical protein [Bacillota bacterium]
MEKIYIDNNSNKQSSLMKIMNYNISGFVSTFVLLVAFALFFVGGFGHNSYALTEEDIGDTFETSSEKYARISGNVSGAISAGIDGDETVYHGVPYIIDKTRDYQYFCLDRKGKVRTNGESYGNGYRIDDTGLLYLLYLNEFLVSFSPSDNSDINITDTTFYGSASNDLERAYVRTWLIQNAIWIYLDEANMTDIISALSSDTSLTITKGEEVLTINQGTNKFSDVILALVTEAKEKKNLTILTPKITASLKSKNMTITSDNKYYVSDVITLGGNDLFDDLGFFYFKLDGAPDGTEIHDLDGNDIGLVQDNSTMKVGTSSKKVRIYIPVDKVKEVNKKFKLSVNSDYTDLRAFGYLPDGYDPAADVTTQSQRVVKSLINVETLNTKVDITVNYTPDVPNTGMNTTQSVYFIGLVMLLCGMGIIYANAKPTKSQQ